MPAGEAVSSGTAGASLLAPVLAPLGDPLPFCIAAGGLAPADVLPWRAAGVNAVVLGSRLGMAKACSNHFPSSAGLEVRAFCEQHRERKLRDYQSKKLYPKGRA